MSKIVERRDFVTAFHNPNLYGFPTPESFLEQCKNVKYLRYLCFQWEITPSNKDENGNVVDVLDTDGTKSITHYQMYLEFSSNTSYKFIQQNLFKGRKVHFLKRFGTQEEAINYCSNKGDYADPKEAKELFVDGFFEWGTPKKTYSFYNKDNPDVPETREEQILWIDDNVKLGNFKCIKDVRPDLRYRSIIDERLIRDIIKNSNPIDASDLVPADVIWIYGKSGDGKSCYSNQLIIKEMGYLGTDITFLKSDRASPLWFKKNDDEKKVLVIEEVRKEWPNHHSLINLIDRKGDLPVKGSETRNNFELIVINSLLSPYDVYKHLPKDKIIEPLRRIYSGKILRIERDDDLYISLINKLIAKEITKKEFMFSLIPKVVHDETKDIPDVLKSAFGIIKTVI